MLVMCPFFYHDCDDPDSLPAASFSVSLLLISGPFVCNSLLLRVCFLSSCLLISLPGFLFSVLPFLLLPFPPSSDEYLLCLQLKFRNGNFYLNHSSALLWTHCQIISVIFVKEILKYKVSQLQLNTTLE